LAEYYDYKYKGVKLDIYRILKVYGITEPAQQHAIKKLFRAGKSIKNIEQDINEVIEALERWKEIIKEDNDEQN
jgi:predicted transcriptional regulator